MREPRRLCSCGFYLKPKTPLKDDTIREAVADWLVDRDATAATYESKRIMSYDRHS